MGAAIGIDDHLFEHLDPVVLHTIVNRYAHTTVILVRTYVFELDRFAIEKRPLVGVKPNHSYPKRRYVGINGLSLIVDPGDKTVEVR